MELKLKARLRKTRLLMTLGQLRLRRSNKRIRKVLRKIPVQIEVRETIELPRTLTGIQTPLMMKCDTALELRGILEDLVLFQETVIKKMQTTKDHCSTYLKKS